MARIKPNILSPTLRLKKRYIVYQVISENKIEFSDIVNAIWNSLLSFAGELNASLSRIWIMKDTWDEEKQIGIIKCAHTAVELVRASLILINRIGESRVLIRILGVSGTIKAAKRKFIQRATLMNFSEGENISGDSQREKSE
jgi:ribonuclease P/MRP protein subunit POP5